MATLGTPVNLYPGGGSSVLRYYSENWLIRRQRDDTFIAVAKTPALPGGVRIIRGTVSGTTITLATTAYAFGGYSGAAHAVCALDNDIFVVAGHMNANIPAGDPTKNHFVIRGYKSTTFPDYVDGGLPSIYEPHTAAQISMVPVSSTQFLIAVDKDSSDADNGWVMLCSYNAVTDTVVVEDTATFASGIIWYPSLVKRDATNYEIYWSDGETNSNIKARTITVSGSTLGALGTSFTIRNNATRCTAEAVNVAHTVVAFADDTDSRNGYAVIVELSAGFLTIGTSYQFNNGVTVQNASLSISSIGNDTFFIYASVGPNWETDTNDMRVYEGRSAAAVITSVTELFDMAQGGRRLGIATLYAETIVCLYTREDDASYDPYAVAISSPANDARVLGASLSKGAGDRLYITMHTGTELALKVYEYPALTELAAYSLGAATPAEVSARTYWAIPYAPYGIDDQVFLLGRLNDPGGLGLVHLIVSVDAGATFDVVENGLGTSHVGAAVETDTWDAYFVVNGASSGCKLYQYDPSGNKIDLKSTIPVTGWCQPHGITPFGNNLIVGNGSADAKLVVYAAPPFANWFDLTFDHAVTNGLNAVVALP